MNTLQGVTEFLTLYPSRLRTPRRITKNLSPGGGGTPEAQLVQIRRPEVRLAEV